MNAAAAERPLIAFRRTGDVNEPTGGKSQAIRSPADRPGATKVIGRFAEMGYDAPPLEPDTHEETQP